jgi:hypothetical protein
MRHVNINGYTKLTDRSKQEEISKFIPLENMTWLNFISKRCNSL